MNNPSTSTRGCGSVADDPRQSGARPDSGFARPRFFDGQLLTEDALQLAVDYFVDKRLLTNRSMFGEGIVCGLEVTPVAGDRSDETLRVGPGYALDGRGHDVYLPHEEMVSITDLVRRKELQLGGCLDCRVFPEGNDGGEPVSRYDLFISYAEAPEGPEARYDSAEAACEDGRVREGSTFSIDCHRETAAGEKSLVDRLKECLDGPFAEKDTALLKQLLDQVDRAATAELDARGRSGFNQTLQDLRRLKAALRDRLRRSPRTLDFGLTKTVDDWSPGAADVKAEAVTIDQWGVLAADARRLLELGDAFTSECLAGVLTPPCRSCAAAGVLLATVDVRGSRIVRVSTDGRPIIASPAALRYWGLAPATAADVLTKVVASGGLTQEQAARIGRLT